MKSLSDNAVLISDGVKTAGHLTWRFRFTEATRIWTPFFHVRHPMLAVSVVRCEIFAFLFKDILAFTCKRNELINGGTWKVAGKTLIKSEIIYA